MMDCPKATPQKTSLTFIPSRVEGADDVTEVTVFPDRLELIAAGETVTVRFFDIAKWPRPRWLRRLLARFGWWPKWLDVADRDWFHPSEGQFFSFYTSPPLVIYMPPNEDKSNYTATTFRKIQEVIYSGHFHTFDLG